MTRVCLFLWERRKGIVPPAKEMHRDSFNLGEKKILYISCYLHLREKAFGSKKDRITGRNG